MSWTGSRDIGQDSGKKAYRSAQTSDPDAYLIDLVSRCVPTEVKPNICFVRLVDHQLRITVDSAGSATRVRFAGSAIKQALKSREGLRVDRVTLHVKPREELMFLQRDSTSRPEPVSEANVKLIESTARGISASAEASGSATGGTPESNDPLAQALQRLADVLKKSI